MKKKLLLCILFFSLMGQAGYSESYKELWKQFDIAMAKDLPKTGIGILEQIKHKAIAERAYGHLLKASLGKAGLQVSISPDSLQNELTQLVQAEKEAQATDPILAAVYQSVLGQVYQNNSYQIGGSKDESKTYFKRSMQNPALLAGASAKDYEPILVSGVDSRVFNNDLLHVLGFAASDYQTLYNYYLSNGNRTAACICARWIMNNKDDNKNTTTSRSSYIHRVDSFINLYADLPEVAELGILRYEWMERSDSVKPKELIDYINYALSKWGNWKRSNIFRNAYKQLTMPTFNVKVDEMAIPNKPLMVRVEDVRNLTNITMNVFRLNVAGDYIGDPRYTKDYNALKKRMKAVPEATRTCRFDGKPNYVLSEDSMQLATLPVGVYMLEFSSNNKAIRPIRTLLYVSNLIPLMESLSYNTIHIAVVNATTGHPVPKAKVRLKTEDGYSDKIKIETLTCDDKGELIYHCKKNSPDEIYVYTKEDKAFRECAYNSYFSFYGGKNDYPLLHLYTDRALYRPGQTVHVAGILIRRGPDLERHASANKSFKLRLYDANHKKIAEKEVTTDDYGKVSADFELPGSGLTGSFSISSGNYSPGNVTFRVEEYKRPTFEVTFPEVTQKYAPGDTVTIIAHAKSYAGVPVQGAKVTYTVKRRPALWWWWRYAGSTNANDIYTSTVTTDDTGGFKVSIPMLLPKDEKQPGFYTFDVLATVTDLGGESRQGSISLPLGSKPTLLSSDLPEKIEKDSLKTITFNYKNAGGGNLNATVRYYINKMEIPLTTPTNTAVSFNVAGLPSGKHHLKAICETDTLEQDFLLFSVKDTRPVVDTTLWSHQTSASFHEDGRPVYIQIGTSQKDVYVFYTIFAGDSILERGTTNISDSLLTRAFTYRPEYKDGIVLNYAWVKDAKFYTERFSIIRATPDKRLIAEWKTFRNKLTPGQKEQWTLTVKHPDGTPADAQMIAGMFDKSLDQIARHQWNFYLGYSFNIPSTYWGWGFSANPNYASASMSIDYLPSSDFQFYHFDYDLFYWNSGFSSRVFGNSLGNAALQEVVVVGYGAQKKAKLTGAVASMDVRGNDMASTASTIKFTAPVIKKDEEVKKEAAVEETTPETGNVSVRENLNETAFFYPALTTDKNGNLSIQFTLPESITTWRFMGLATDKQMNYGMLEGETVAQKTIMVQPNMPRFMRLGDHGTIATKIFNTSEKTISGVAKLELLDPETEKVVYTVNKKYTVRGGATDNVNFDVNIQQGNALYAAGAQVLICKIIAVGNGYTDGEQHYLPLLPDRELVTNSVAFTQHTAGIKTINLEKLFAVKDASDRLTIEYTDNPAWLMIQALPYVSEVSSHNAISLAAAYYANSIAQYILKQAPIIKHTIELWKQEKGKEISLMSSLQKNEELKLMVLNETPWVNEAENEAAQKQALLRYFDENSIENRLNTCLERLRKLQNSDGSWSWYPGMRGSSYVTLSVSEMLVRLQTMIGLQGSISSNLRRAFMFMNKELKREVAWMQKEEKKGIKNLRPSEWAVQYLYASSLTEKSYLQNTTAERQYMVDHLSKQTVNFTIYGKAISAVILGKNGYAQMAKEYLQSISEYSVYKEEMGRYYDTRKAYYSWFDYKIPTQVAAIEAIKLLNPNDEKTLDEMQRWLLMSKRTQCWDTPINSVNAVYAFLDGNISRLQKSAQQRTILSVNGKKLDLPKATAGLGYVKVSMTGDNMKTFTANKTSKGTSWGAVYAQFMQKTTDVADASMGLTVKREFLNAKDLKVGDKVKVRITIVADHDYDFVQVVDKRAACMEPINQLSGYRNGYYCTPRDNSTCYYMDRMAKGRHVIETEYYIDRQGTFSTGTCTVQCAYSPEYSARTTAQTLNVKQ